MTSILTNISSISAFQTLRSIDKSLVETHGRVSTGLRVATASHDAAYWSISTTMRSDNGALSAAADAIALGSAKVDTAFNGMNAVIDVLATFKAKLVAAQEESADKSKIQTELNQLKDQVVGIATSSSFSGENWLNTNVEQIFDINTNGVSVVSSFQRSSQGISVSTIDVHLDEISLFNTTGGGLLQADPRDVKTLGGMRYQSPFDDSGSATVYYTETESAWMNPSRNNGTIAGFSLKFPDGTPLDFNEPGAEMQFGITLDREYDPASDSGVRAELNDLPGPYYAGYSNTLTFTKADVDAYDASLGGIISTNTQFAGLLNSKLVAEGARVYANYGHYEPYGSSNWVHDKVAMTISTLESHGDGSFIEITNLSTVGVSTGGLVENNDFGDRGSGMSLKFEQFALQIDGDKPDGVAVDFSFSINGAPSKSYNFNRTYVNDLLGKETGAVETADEMVTLLKSFLDADWPDVVIEVSAADPGYIIVKSDAAVDRKWGGSTRVGFSNIKVSIEPLPAINFMNIDIGKNPDLVDHYINYMEVSGQRIIAGASVLGALQSRIEMQSVFAEKMMATMERGIGRLVDADMNEESTRLKALETQQQLSTQTLQIANSEPEAIIRLFQ